MTNQPTLTPSADVRRRLVAGEPLTSEQVATDYGVSRSLLGTVIGSLQHDGATIDRTLDGPDGFTAYREATTEPDPTQWGKSANVREPVKRRKTKPAAKPEPEPKPVPMPALGEQLTVYLVALTNNGRVNVGLRAGKREWLATITP